MKELTGALRSLQNSQSSKVLTAVPRQKLDGIQRSWWELAGVHFWGCMSAQRKWQEKAGMSRSWYELAPAHRRTNELLGSLRSSEELAGDCKS